MGPTQNPGGGDSRRRNPGDPRPRKTKNLGHCGLHGMPNQISFPDVRKPSVETRELTPAEIPGMFFSIVLLLAYYHPRHSGLGSSACGAALDSLRSGASFRPLRMRKKTALADAPAPANFGQEDVRPRECRNLSRLLSHENVRNSDRGMPL